MSGGFDLEALEAAVRAARARDAEAAVSPAPPPGGDPDVAHAIRARLEEHRNCKAGVPLGPGPRPVGTIARKIFRRLLQPFLDETLERQSRFNEATCDLAAELFARLDELEQEVRALRVRDGERAAPPDADRGPGPGAAP